MGYCKGAVIQRSIVYRLSTVKVEKVGVILMGYCKGAVI